jgi:uncharacterized membrane protein
MVSLRTFIPETIPTVFSGLASGSILDTVWKLLVILLTIVVAFLLVASGPFGAAIGGIVVATLFSERIRQLYGDLYRREFWIWRT